MKHILPATPLAHLFDLIAFVTICYTARPSFARLLICYWFVSCSRWLAATTLLAFLLHVHTGSLLRFTCFYARVHRLAAMLPTHLLILCITRPLPICAKKGCIDPAKANIIEHISWSSSCYRGELTQLNACVYAPIAWHFSEKFQYSTEEIDIDR